MAPLHNAAKRGNLAEVRRLLNEGANINARSNGTTPLMNAAFWGHANVVRLLINRGANTRARVSANNQRTALLFAVERGKKNAVRALIRHSNLNVKDPNGRTALTVAANLNHPEIVKMLVRAGAHVNDNNVKYLINGNFTNHNMRNLLGSALVRRAFAKKTLTNKVKEAHIARRTHAMRGQLRHAQVHEGGSIVTGLPLGARNLIAEMMRQEMMRQGR